MNVSLEAFRLVNDCEQSWARDADSLFVVALLMKSADRRLKAGHAGLMIEAAQTIVGFYAPAVSRMYLDRGILADLSESECDRLANELATDMANSQSLKREVAEMLRVKRTIVLENEEWSKLGSELTYHGECEAPLATMNRWLDYVEYLKSIGYYEYVVRLHRLLVCCLRVHNAVLSH